MLLMRGIEERAKRLYRQGTVPGSRYGSGRDGNVHFGDWRVGCVGMVAMLKRHLEERPGS